MGIGAVGSADGLAAWGQLVDDRAFEVGVKGHGEGSRDGCGSHHKDMRRDVALMP